MGNCLVTRLKGVADNENLPVFGSFRIDVEPGEFQFRIASTDVDTLTFDNAVDDIYVGPDIVQSGWRSTSGTEFRVHSTLTRKTTFFVDNAYLTTKFALEERCNYSFVQTPSFKYMPINTISVAEVCTCKPLNIELPDTVTHFEISGSATNRAADGFDFDTIVVNPAIETFICFNSNVKGNISKFNSAINLTYFAVQRNPNVVGTVEEFIEAQIANGREINIDNLDLRYTSVKMNNRPVESYIPNVSFTVVITPTGCDLCEYHTETVVASYNKNTGTWTYSS